MYAVPTTKDEFKTVGVPLSLVIQPLAEPGIDCVLYSISFILTLTLTHSLILTLTHSLKLKHTHTHTLTLTHSYSCSHVFIVLVG
jgi:hypothetical protein